jgi:4-hydroxy-4-methyl-2-oxoglutarate aldolase
MSDPRADEALSRRDFLRSGAASVTATVAAAATAAAAASTTAAAQATPAAGEQPTFATSPAMPAGPHRVVSRIERPSAEIVARFKQVVREFVTDAVGRSQWMDPAIKPVANRDWNLCGPAVTVKLEAVDHLMCIAALGVAQPGDVIVVAANGVTHTAVWGGGLTLSAKNLGAAGVVVDGAVLDAHMIVERNLPVFSRGCHPAHGSWKTPGSVNVPVSCGGVVVNPGDLLFGDLDGVVVVRREQALAVLEECEEKSKILLRTRERMNASKETFFSLRGGRKLVESAGVQWVD